jgi:TPP-dependent pyruvate/acetoin dehydrogenase alpha subunit
MGGESLLERFFVQMTTIRTVEERLLRLFSEGLLNGTVHTCIGQEACAVGVVGALDRTRDIIFSNHRGHGHFLAYCDDVEGLIAELMGRSKGVCGGLGGSQHLHKDNFYSNGVQGGIVPVATGMALAEKEKGSGAIVAVFLGDGTFGEGVVYESLNIAALWALPILFVVEHNGYAQSTPSSLEHAGALDARTEPFGIPAAVLEVKDPCEVHAAAKTLVDSVRQRSTPRALFLLTYRLSPHSKGDDNRDPAEVDRYRCLDPLRILREKMEPVWRDGVEMEVRQRVERAVEKAREMPIDDFYERERQWKV